MTSSTDKEHQCFVESQNRCELEVNIEILRNVNAFSGIPLERLKLYAYLSRRMCYRAGEFIFRQGERDNRGYIIVSGKAQLVREYEDRSVFLEELKEGEFFGGLALLSNIKRLFSVQALDNVECLTLDRESFRKLLLQFPEVAIKILDVMIKRISMMEEKILTIQARECHYG